MIVDAHMHMEEAYPAEILKEQDIACIANAATPEAVSYTHLDVYKRQVL